MPNHIAILGSLLVGLAATLGTIVIHGFAVHTIIMALRRNLQRGVLGARIWVNMIFIMSAMLIALAGHLMEITFWAFALDICGAVAKTSARPYLFIGWQLHDYGFRTGRIVPPRDGSCWDHYRSGGVRNVNVRPGTTAFVFASHPTPEFTPGSMTRITSFFDDAGVMRVARALATCDEDPETGLLQSVPGIRSV